MMARQIAATPILSGREASRFLCALYKNESKKVEPTPTPKLAKARELIKQHSKGDAK
jgi:hypothetical protein